MQMYCSTVHYMTSSQIVKTEKRWIGRTQKSWRSTFPMALS